jgi:hypothetical protein
VIKNILKLAEPVDPAKPVAFGPPGVGVIKLFVSSQMQQQNMLERLAIIDI